MSRTCRKLRSRLLCLNKNRRCDHDTNVNKEKQSSNNYESENCINLPITDVKQRQHNCTSTLSQVSLSKTEALQLEVNNNKSNKTYTRGNTECKTETYETSTVRIRHSKQLNYNQNQDISASNSSVVDVAASNSSVVDGAASNSSVVDGAANNSSVVDGAASNSSVVDGAVSNSSVVDGAANNSSVVDGAANNSSVVDGAASNSSVVDVAAKVLNEGRKEDVSGSGLDSDCGPELHLCSQEVLLCSTQDPDYQCEVKWDYLSSETVKQAKRFEGHYGTEEIKKIVSNFSDAEVKQQKDVKHSFKQFLPAKTAKKSRSQKAKERTGRKFQQRFHNRESVNEVIRWLHDGGSKQKAGIKEKYPQYVVNSSSAVITEPSKEVCDNDIDDKITEAIPSCNDDDFWSDEDLFINNCILFEATQSTENFFSTSHNVVVVSNTHPSKHLCWSEDNKMCQKESFLFPVRPVTDDHSPDKLNDSLSIPASSALCQMISMTGIYSSSAAKNVNKFPVLYKNCSSETADKQSANKSDGTCNAAYCRDGFKQSDVTIEEHFKLANVAVSTSDASVKGKCTMDMNKIISRNSQPAIMISPPETCKTFQGNIQAEGSSAGNIHDSDGRNNNLVSNLNLSISRNVDAVLSHRNDMDQLHKTNILSEQDVSYYPFEPISLTSVKCGLSENVKLLSDLSTYVKPYSYLPAESGKVLSDISTESYTVNQTDQVFSPILSLEQDDAFDVDLPDDVVQKLLEVDDNFDNQNDITSTSISAVATEADFSYLFDDEIPVFDRSLDTVLAQLPNSSNSNEPENITLKEENNNKCCVLRPDRRQPSLPELTKAPFSPLLPKTNVKSTPNKNSPKRFTFKRIMSAQQNTQHSLRPQKHRQSSLPNSNTPVKYSKNDNNILLAEAEAMVSQAESSVCSQVKCSPEEIEQKRQAALHRRSQRLSQMNRADRKMH